MTSFQKYLQFLRTQFTPGSRVLLLSGDQPNGLPTGSMGTLTKVDSAGRFLVDWDTGQHTALHLEDDQFRLFQPEPMELKLYFPLTADLYTRNEWGDFEDDPEELTGRDLTPYLGDIQNALEKNLLPEEQGRGMMQWYGVEDALAWKVKSAFFGVEEQDGVLWGVADCQILEPLENEELKNLIDYLSLQASDGWGEGFEQRPISLDRAELYVHLLQGQNLEMSQGALTQQEESPQMGMAP